MALPSMCVPALSVTRSVIACRPTVEVAAYYFDGQERKPLSQRAGVALNAKVAH